jgi:hypothetical protein
MHYINQYDYPDVSYPHRLAGGRIEEDTVANSGCGLCVMIMITEALTGRQLSMPQCRDIAVEAQANKGPGTNLSVLGRTLGERFGFTLETTDDLEKLKAHVQKGLPAALNAGGDRPGYTGLLSRWGHYLVAREYDPHTDTFTLLDPAWTPGKYKTPERKEKVRENYPDLYVHAQDVARDCANRSPAYYLFAPAEV